MTKRISSAAHRRVSRANAAARDMAARETAWAAEFRAWKAGIDPDYERDNPNACWEWIDQMRDESRMAHGLPV